MLKRFFVIAAASVLTAGTALSAVAPDAIAFMSQVRRPTGQQSYAQMDGVVRHLRKGSDTIEYPLYFGIMLTEKRRLSQIIVNNAEGYNIGQSYSSGNEGTTVTPMRDGGYQQSILGNFGIRPEDLSMSFLYWNVFAEEPKSSFRTVDCRVFLLKNPQSAEMARAYISEDSLFPVKVEFFPDDKTDNAPERTMEVEKFKKTDNDFWVPTQLKLYGPGWRTQVVFKNVTAENLDPKNPPTNVLNRKIINE